VDARRLPHHVKSAGTAELAKPNTRITGLPSQFDYFLYSPIDGISQGFSLLYTLQRKARSLQKGVGCMMWSILITAIGLLFVFEGILPFLSPRFWRKIMSQMFVLSDRAIRITGLASMLIGLALVCIARDLFQV